MLLMFSATVLKPALAVKPSLKAQGIFTATVANAKQNIFCQVHDHVFGICVVEPESIILCNFL